VQGCFIATSQIETIHGAAYVHSRASSTPSCTALQDAKRHSPGAPRPSTSQALSQASQPVAAGQTFPPGSPEHGSSSSRSSSLEPTLHPDHTTSPPAQVAGSIASSVSTDSRPPSRQGGALARPASEAASDSCGSEILSEEEEEEDLLPAAAAAAARSTGAPSALIMCHRVHGWVGQSRLGCRHMHPSFFGGMSHVHS
jgi:hypothetical protein